MAFTREQAANLMPTYRAERQRILENSLCMAFCRRTYGPFNADDRYQSARKNHQSRLASIRAMWAPVREHFH